MDADLGAMRHLWMSPWTLWVGFRYLKSKKNSSFLSFITLLSIFGVGLGVTAMIVVLSIMDGFESELKKRMTSSDLHILVTPTPALQEFDAGVVPASLIPAEKIQRIGDLARNHVGEPSGGIEKFWPMVSTEAILKSGKKVTGIVLKGIDEDRMTRLKTQLVETAESRLLVEKDGAQFIRLPGIYMGRELAYEMGVIPSDQVTLISPLEMEGPMNAVPRTKRFTIEGIYSSGHPEQELHVLYAKDGSVNAFLRKSGGVTQWEISVKNFDHAPAIADLIRQELPGFRVQDWMQLNSNLFASLKLERLSMFIILAFIIIVASFNIVTTLTLMVLEKKKEIAILKTMGARHGQVAAIFLSEGIFIGALGVGGGTALGFLLCSLLKRFQFIELPDIYYDRTLPVTFDLRYYVVVSLCALLIVLAACLYPSKRAARLNALDGIRFG